VAKCASKNRVSGFKDQVSGEVLRPEDLKLET
jgi:hypothetical protein